MSKDALVAAKKKLKKGAKRTGRVTAKLVERGRHRVPRMLDSARGRFPTIEFRRRKTTMDKIFSRFTLGFAVGYVLGSRAGRERYEQIRRWWDSFTGRPTVQQAAEKGKEMVSDAGRSVVGELRSRVRAQSIREVMTPNPHTVKASSPVAEAARKMREADAGAMVVVDESNRVIGIVTDRDIAVRAVAEGKDPASTPISEVASPDLTTLTPSDSVDRAVRLMREHALRRLPVVEDGRPVGMVSIGDLAVERDPDSALADISAREPNR